ncbi:SWI/SNF-related matrix-associated actin-dependent regulator of chromatin subfamily A containing DEAD/H box 1 [Lingula anatina]|uniref:DNA helicase n=1 Tax=Lingula anatina TaxID=7574 RepID=A0A1S3K3B0_LINAN|nr:SWI/SNF-related matrix-associated actin-dependent regulator of chromatin subfamily A containing DEAD/H box 1 [Lingula anatina]|eukprot:XP_013416751.1 SWI/SNF-related matrix-associated actin-dependent regulator of chromatin subfamily A containing DEAD/H box 1 [Lingula anatina]
MSGSQPSSESKCLENGDSGRNKTGVSSLLKYRFQKTAVNKVQSVKNGVEVTRAQPSTPEKQQVTVIPETPEASHPSPISSPIFTKVQQDSSPMSSPVFTKTKGRKAPARILETDSEEESAKSPLKTPSSPWLSKEFGKQVLNGTVDLSHKAETEFCEKLTALQELFPTRPRVYLEQAIKSTPNLDQAIDAVIAFDTMGTSERKRSRQESQESVESDISFPRSKKCRPLRIDSSSSQHSQEEEVASFHIDEETKQERIRFLKEAFPNIPEKDLSVVLSDNQWSMEQATESLTAFQSQGDDQSNQQHDGDKEVIEISDEDSNQPSTSLPVKQQHIQYTAKRKNIKDFEEEEEEFEMGAYDSDSSIEFDEDDSRRQAAREMVFSFFNEAIYEELLNMPTCSKKKAELIMSLRPFESFQDLVEKFDSTKGLSYDTLTGCQELIRTRAAVTKLMLRCEDISRRMESLVSRLTGDVALHGEEGEITRQPSVLNSDFTLKPYQMVGLNWIRLMHKQELNGILADEMGLGKTIQAIAFLAHLLEIGDTGPHIIIVPSSTLDNWLRELKVWCPSLEVCVYYGSQSERAEIRYQILGGQIDFNVMVTSYNIATGTAEDRGLFKKFKFHYAVLDEAHMLKNMSSARYQSLMRVSASRRLLLTGTPLQNNLVELMSLLCFVMPEIFVGKTEQLKRIFSTCTKGASDNSGRSEFEKGRIAHAKRIMKPFVLRRLKSEVLKQLPAKVEKIHHCPLTNEQRRLYDELVTKYSAQSLKEDQEEKGSSILMQLRKMANHQLLHRNKYPDNVLRHMAKLMLKEPTHTDANEEYIYEDMQVMSDFELHKLCQMYKVLSNFDLKEEVILETGKFRVLDDFLPDMKTKGDRVLLFSQFTMMLDIIEEYMKARGHRYFRLDGSTPVVERQEMIDRFNNDKDIFIFLLSTKAGGLGINLTSANVVILHDIDFNPYNDKQAEDRCHRVGQTRDVTVIRLIASNTVEEAMLACANQKLQLEQDLTGKQNTSEASVVVKLLKESLKAGTSSGSEV